MESITKNLDNDLQQINRVVCRLRSICTQKYESDQNHLFSSLKESKTIKNESPKFDESIPEFLRQPTKSMTSTKGKITEVNDNDEIIIAIRELNEIPLIKTSQTPRFVGCRIKL